MAAKQVPDRTDWVYLEQHSIQKSGDKTFYRFNRQSAPLTDSIVLQSKDSDCRGGSPLLIVTGTNVKWYADVGKKIKLAEGNTYQSLPLDQTTTFYLTQTIAGVETPPVAIRIEIVEAFLRNIVTTPASCGKNDGTISVTATGSTAHNPMYYSLNKGLAQRSPVFTNLTSGTYLLMDSVSTGCWGTIDVTVAGPPSPIISSIVTGNPHCGQADGTLTVAAYEGGNSLSYSLNGVDYIPDYQFTHLAGGAYQVWVRNQNGCSVSQRVSLQTSVKLQLGTIDRQATSCGQSNGRIGLQGTTGNGSLSYALDNGQVNTSGVFTSLAAKTYVVTVSDEMGCYDTRAVSIDPSEGPTISQIRQEPPSCGQADGSLTISAHSSSRLSYRLNGMVYQVDSTFGQLPNGQYEVTVEDSHHCLAQQRVDLGEACQQTVYLPDSFSPNRDGLNDGWAIFVPNNRTYLEDLRIFNRWGEVILHREPHLLTSGEVMWNGTHNGQVQSGSYTYELSVRFSSGVTQVYRGTILLIAE